MKLVHIPIIIKNILANLRFLCRYNIEEDIIKNEASVTAPLKQNKYASKKDLIELFFSSKPLESLQYQEELFFLKEHGIVDAFPYQQIKRASPRPCNYDSKIKLPFIIHKNKKLYFPANWDIDRVKETYTNYIERENLLGGGYTKKAPHQYQTDNFKIEKDDILLDIGCAEALLALDNIEILKKAYLFESDEQWIKPLQATFAQYKDKVTIISKFVSNVNSNTTITLNSILENIKNESFFIKMDIEGEEENVLKSSETFLTSQNNIKLACCTYHKAKHAESISHNLKRINYDVSFSDGFMLFLLDTNFTPPYFRKGIIRGRKR